MATGNASAKDKWRKQSHPRIFGGAKAERLERFTEMVKDRRYGELMDALHELGVHGHRYNLIEKSEAAAILGANANPLEAAPLSAEDATRLLGLGTEEGSAQQAQVLVEIAGFGDATMGAVKVGVPLDDLDRWEQTDLNGWKACVGRALRLYEGRLMKVLLELMGQTGPGARNTQGVVKLLEAVNPERWARSRRLDASDETPLDDLLRAAEERNRRANATDSAASPFFA